MMVRLIAACVLMAMAGGASAQINVSATCSGDAVTIGVTVFNTYAEDMTGFVIERWEIGTCAPPAVITPDQIPLPPPTAPYPGGTAINYVLEFPVPFPGINYRYAALVTDAAGQAHEIPNPYYPLSDCQLCTSDIASCQDAVIMRGVVLLLGLSSDYADVLVVPCQDGCWGEFPEFQTVPADHPLVTNTLTGTVDIYGAVSDGRCFGDNGGIYEVTRITPAPNGACGPVPEAPLCFGSLKAMYR
jgi:hypothetical protein